MEVAIGKAKARLSELVTAVGNGDRVVITRHGRPAAQLVACDRPVAEGAAHGAPGGIDFDKLEEVCRKLGIAGDGEPWPETWNDPAFSRQVLGLEEDE